MFEKLSNIDIDASASSVTSNHISLFRHDKIYIGVIHKGDFLIICPTASSTLVNRVKPKLSPVPTIQQAAWIGETNPLLVLATDTALQIFDWDGSMLLFTTHSHSSQGTPRGQTASPLFRGIAGMQSGKICVGTYDGCILVLGQEEPDGVALYELGRMKWFEKCVTSITSAAEMLVAGNNDGVICIANEDEDGQLVRTRTIQSYGSSVTVLRLHDQMLIGGYSSGHVRIFHSKEANIIAEICCHSQSVSSLDIAPQSGMLLTTSEDTFVRVWKLDQSSQTSVEHKYSQSETNTLLCGGCFSDSTGSGFYLTGYDMSAIMVYAM